MTEKSAYSEVLELLELRDKLERDGATKEEREAARQRLEDAQYRLCEASLAWREELNRAYVEGLNPC